MESVDFWTMHGWLFLIAMLLFPRITMFFTGIAFSFGILGFLGFVFFPYLTAAVLATEFYWHTNPVLCIVAWVVALSGTGVEEEVAFRRIRRRYRAKRIVPANVRAYPPRDASPSARRGSPGYRQYRGGSSEEVIDVDFEREN